MWLKGNEFRGEKEKKKRLSQGTGVRTHRAPKTTARILASNLVELGSP